jgi:hypothetical protein
MLDRLDIVELGEAGLGEHVERLAGGIGQEVEVELLQRRDLEKGHFGARTCLWKNMGKSLAEACARLQGKLSSPVRQIRSTASQTVHRFRPQAVDRGEEARDSADGRGFRRVKLLAKGVRIHKPRSASYY